jgi:p-aminobenzoyl-glutamate transporter AbgT
VKKPHQIWALVSPAMHKKLKEYAVENQIASTRAKMIMYILYNFHPDQLLEDYTFQSRVGKMVNIKVSDVELEYIKNLAQRYNVTISRLLRNMVYTYFHSMGENKMFYAK